MAEYFSRTHILITRGSCPKVFENRRLWIKDMFENRKGGPDWTAKTQGNAQVSGENPFEMS